MIDMTAVRAAIAKLNLKENSEDVSRRIKFFEDMVQVGRLFFLFHL